MASKRAKRRQKERQAARKREERRRRSCVGKRRHETLGQAIAHITHYRYKFQTANYYYYPCEFCGGYHTGHRSEEAHQRMVEWETARAEAAAEGG